MKHFQILSRGIDIIPLLLAIKRRHELWKDDTYLRDYPQGPFADVESIILRFPDKAVVQSGGDEHENQDQTAYKLLPEARVLIANLMRYIEGERLGRVIINKIRPGGRIYPHSDSPNHASYYSRFHIVLQSQPGVDFRAGDEHVFMAPGEAWWFNNAVEHEVINNSADDRIHLIIDLRTSR